MAEAEYVNPIPAPRHVPASGWLQAPQHVLCWVRAEAGKIVELKIATDYDVTVFDSGVGDPVEAVLDSGTAVPR